MAPRNGTGDRSIAEEVVFGNVGLGDDLDALDAGGGADDNFDDDDFEGGAADDLSGEHDDDISDIRNDQRDQRGLDDLSDRQRQRAGERRQSRDQFGRPRRGERQQQRPQDQTRQMLDDLGVSHTRIPPAAEVRPDKNGNLVNKEGVIVARQGREARYYQDAFKSRQESATHQGRVREVEGRLNEVIGIARNLDTELKVFKGQQAQITQLGIKPEDQVLALRMFKDLNDNPVQTIKGILTRANARGITMDQLGLGAGGAGAFDAKTMSELIQKQVTDALKPVNERVALTQQQEEQQRQQDQISQQAQRDVNSFFQDNPEATRHIAVFKGLLDDPKWRGVSLSEMWARIQLNLATRRNPAQRPNGQSRTPRRGSMPQGRRAPMQMDASPVADINQSYDDILVDVMDQIGIQR